MGGGLTSGGISTIRTLYLGSYCLGLPSGDAGNGEVPAETTGTFCVNPYFSEQSSFLGPKVAVSWGGFVRVRGSAVRKSFPAPLCLFEARERPERSLFEPKLHRP